nr:MAG TPA: hypothetical protein [Caudoviricetes sp.]
MNFLEYFYFFSFMLCKDQKFSHFFSVIIIFSHTLAHHFIYINIPIILLLINFFSLKFYLSFHITPYTHLH